MDIEFPANEYDFMVLKLFERSDSIEKIDINMFYSTFIDEAILNPGAGRPAQGDEYEVDHLLFSTVSNYVT
jgi:hypothetical protein